MCDVVLPGDAQQFSEAAHVKGVESLVRVQGPNFTVGEGATQDGEA